MTNKYPSNLSLSDDLLLQQNQNGTASKQRLECLICNYRIDPRDESLFVTFPCNVRAFRDEKFKVWRCPNCRTIHCLDIVDLDRYYAKYPIAQAVAHDSARACYKNILKRLKKHGFDKNHTFLDYGCGGNGLFVKYLQELGFANVRGYDPYSPHPEFNNAKILEPGKFDYILLQDIIEHVEDPHTLLSELDNLLAPGGYILVATPNADNIDLSQPNLAEYYNEVHVPYHLHMYTQQTLELLGKQQNWEVVSFFERPFHDLLFGMNSRMWNQYVRLFDGSLDVIYEPSQPVKALTSLKFIFYMIFGYWLSFKTNMAVMFRKKNLG
ncbi:MAG: class I SAM-dependent methyltransferase [Nostoc sp. ChiSLP02]|nr:class I SAM-dependent methyltransferase [Nostoc sp. DedSLP05]MDZ8102839.1 class I SAM-dependent methyltransferase [Nostoc sp. DedSLP01]MDZ8184150.1 class I SAM-dependent methyltransferase [Nostoc sp. ChiSLP02]